ncbi:IclR family transcriptional regulator C-terminal domain-containing protein [Actinomycetospora sp. TBRC 11914]|uniref:IclR family transcriptional regulator n=1 Tax=Actinomycetospora sp. TBRC 11914 TaxID=2729387 RepID=UPI00145EF705|nr:IclR family transcriptional regulator C-terminal domain-containing protein [Actinomycetospora sp. TBRC 11914]NMO93967.1 helix-turn-helix domain-containing protein [Actinomycetospora sp. TBRC 11914]
MSEDTSGARSLKTAAMVLRALRLLGDHPEGLSPAEIGAHLGKSSATARYMVNTLVEAGYARRDAAGRCRLTAAPPWGPWVPTTPPEGTGSVAELSPGDPAPGAVLAEAVTELYRRTRQRTYLVRRTGTVVASISDVRGHQGLARVPGLDTHIPPERAHALGLTKVLLAASPIYREAVCGEELAAFTPSTITCPIRFAHELDEVAERGWALDDGEFAPGFATVAAPVTAPSGTSTVAIGLSCSVRRLASHRDELVAAVVAVAEAARREWGAGTAGGVEEYDDGCGPSEGTAVGPPVEGTDHRPRPLHRRRRVGRTVSGPRR